MAQRIDLHFAGLYFALNFLQVVIHLLDAGKDLLGWKSLDDIKHLPDVRLGIDHQDSIAFGFHGLLSGQNHSYAGAANKADIGHIKNEER